MASLPSLEYDLGKGASLKAFILASGMSVEDLEGELSQKHGEATLDQELLSSIRVVEDLDSLSDLRIEATDEDYIVPDMLAPFRQHIEDEEAGKPENQRKTNGPVMVVDGEVTHPLQVIRAGYFDFLATKLDQQPFLHAEGSENYSKATTRDLMPGWRMGTDQLARYLGIAFVMNTSGGEEISLVQRAKGMGIAADCISFSGSTPPFSPDFFTPGFDFGTYLAEHIVGKMWGEYKLEDGEFEIGKVTLLDDELTIPFLSVEITTPLSSRELALRNHGVQRAINEHPVIYSVNPGDVDQLLETLPVLYSTQFLLIS